MHGRMGKAHTYSQPHIDIIRKQVIPLLKGFTNHPEASLHVRVDLQQTIVKDVTEAARQGIAQSV